LPARTTLRSTLLAVHLNQVYSTSSHLRENDQDWACLATLSFVVLGIILGDIAEDIASLFILG
jgi:uncharacterized membrane protein YfcA